MCRNRGVTGTKVCRGRRVANVSKVCGKVWPMCSRCVVTEVCRGRGMADVSEVCGDRGVSWPMYGRCVRGVW